MIDPGLVVLGLFLLAGAIAYFVFASFVFGAGYQPTPRAVVESMLSLAELRPGESLIDLGAGTGAIVFRAARHHGAMAVGVEVEPLRVAILRGRRWVGGPRDRVRIQWGNLFGTDLRGASVVTCFLWPGAMEKLRSKFERELPEGARVVSYWHAMPGWTPDRTVPRLRVYLYRRPKADGADLSARASAAPQSPP